MESWVWLALLSPAFLTVVNFIDKYVIENKVKDYQGIPVFSALIGLIVGTLFWIVTGFQTLPVRDGVIVLLTGFLTLHGYYFYFHAIAKSATSYIIALLQMTPVLTLILSVYFLHDTITIQHFLGFLLVLGCVVAFSLQKEKDHFQLNSSFWYILIADSFFALANILLKFTLHTNSFIQLFPYESWGLGIGGISLFLLFPSVRSAFIDTYRTAGKSVLGILSINEIIFIFSKVTNFLAIAIGPVALVSVLSGIQVFYGVFFGWILMLIAPKVFREDVSKEGLLKKLLLTSILFLGIWLVA